MIKNNDKTNKIAEYLLQIKAVKFQPNDPFTWSSGWKSPIYCDNRKTLSYPNIRTFLRQNFAATIQDEFGQIDMIAGVATGGIAIGALTAQEMGKPFIYVRSSAKGHGLKNQIEGDLTQGNDVVVIEDLISTGGSSLKAVEALREAGLNVKGVVSIFHYGFEAATNAFAEAKCKLLSLCDYETMLPIALELGAIKEEDVESLKEWRKAPEKWGK